MRMLKNQSGLPATSSRGLLNIIALLLLTAFISMLIIFHFVLYPLPDTLVMITGMEGGSYSVFGQRYREILAREKVRLELLPSSGSVENLQRLHDKSFRVNAGFVQGGMSSAAEAQNLVSLGGLCYTPLWVFHRGKDTLGDLSQLRGKRITIGPEGSGVRKFALDILRASNAAEPPTLLLDLSSMAATQALLEGKVDVVMIFGTPDNTLVQKLLYAKDVKLMNFRQAEAYTRLFPALSHVILPEGILNLSQKMPPADIHLPAPTTNLVVRKNLHPAMIYLLLDAATEIHSGAGWVHKAGEFPSPKSQDFPLGEYAERFYKSGRPFLLDYLPFWMAVYIDRMVFILVPLVVVLLPLMRIIPWLYSWRNRRKFYWSYRELKNLELEVLESPQPERTRDYLERLDRIEASINEIRVPLALFNEVYMLKQHVDLVRGKLSRLIQQPQGGQPSIEPQAYKGRGD